MRVFDSSASTSESRYAKSSGRCRRRESRNVSVDSYDSSESSQSQKLTTNRFLGVQSPADVTHRLRPGQFALYYAKPRKVTSIDELPVHLPLKLALLHRDGRVFHFNVIETVDELGPLYFVDTKAKVRHSPGFRYMQALISHYEGDTRRNSRNESIYCDDDQFTLPEFSSFSSASSVSSLHSRDL